MHTDTNHDHEAGFGLVEIAFSGALFVTGVVGLIGTMLSCLVLVRDTKETSVAHDELVTVIESIKDSAVSDFDTAITTLVNTPTHTVSSKGLGAQATIRSVLVLDETRINPPLDLNGDGDTVDTGLSPSEVSAAYIRTTISWESARGNRTIRLDNVVARASMGMGTTETTVETETSPETGGTETGGTEGGTSEPTGDGPAISVAEYGFPKETEISMSIGVTGVGSSPVSSVTVQSSYTGYVKQVQVAGSDVFNTKSGMPAVGTAIDVQPFFLEEGVNVIDKIKIQETADGGNVDIRNETFKVTFHFEDGTSTSFAPY